MGCLTKLALHTSIPSFGTGKAAYVVAPVAGTVVTVYTVACATTSGAAETITVADGDGNSMGTVTVANGAVTGEKDSLTPTANNVVAAAEVISFTSAGSCTCTGDLDITVEFDPA